MQFTRQEEHHDWLEGNSSLPNGFAVGTVTFPFTPREKNQKANMTMTLISLDEPTSSFAGMFTQNSFPGAPVLIGRERLRQETLKALLINNKISNVGVSTGVQDAEEVCAALCRELGGMPEQIIPSSTGIIGWRIPVEEMKAHLGSLVEDLQTKCILPAAKGIMTTDLYPKIRRIEIGDGSIVATGKGAGMVEPNLATMLVFILTDIDISRDDLRFILREIASESFNAISIDSDQSTSDSVIAVSSGMVKGVPLDHFKQGLKKVCLSLAQDIVRNGEGVHHVIEVQIEGAPSSLAARELGKTLLRSPLFKTAICGNDPNVGRLVMALGNHRSSEDLALDFSRLNIKIGEECVFSEGSFSLTDEREQKLTEYMKRTELYSSDETFQPPVSFPPHERNLVIQLSLGLGEEKATVWGGDLTHEYISENADYRS